MKSSEYRAAAAQALGLSYPSLGTTDPVEIAKAQAFALLAIAEELAAARVADTSGAPEVEHVTTFTPSEDPGFPGLPAAEWTCSCGAGSSRPITPPTAERRIREHLADQVTGASRG